ncbi:hypothetical protein [Streptomyces sp. ITFR-6]|uniref:hypothetical protein n=1 Tax=Streptomyces sp. ITFR-6 TaxID=3075197 RepID=UPI00288A1DF3|nr:hypothetical protein [Streptomyces sp. ITFR-6]WNI31836.1 hypothetical protein RLT59_25910 [Streptomyces sp. ITFR-6]
MRTSNEHADCAEAPAMRLLPWTGEGGKPCYVLGDGTGYVSRTADNVECVQLGMADELLGHAADLLADGEVTGPQIRFLAGRLTESLGQVLRVAQSRGSRLDAALPDRFEERPAEHEPDADAP